jgi:hypothetical protein
VSHGTSLDHRADRVHAVVVSEVQQVRSVQEHEVGALSRLYRAYLTAEAQ